MVWVMIDVTASSQPTLLTRILQWGLPGFLDVGWILICAGQVPRIQALLADGEAASAIATYVIPTVFLVVLTIGSMKRWRWAFWIFLLLLIAWAGTTIWQGGPHTTFELVAAPIATVLLV